MVMSLEEIIEELLSPDGPSALVLREELEPAEGKSAVFFPPTYAPPEGVPREQQRPTYVFDSPEGFSSTCIIDSVESQANRLEALFKQEKYRDLVPKVIIQVEEKGGGKVEINLLDASHRIADALVRCSELADEITKALNEFRQNGYCTSIARIAPTSILFGFWDSRETGVKFPRLLRSEIRAWKVRMLSRKAQFTPALLKEFKPEKESRVYRNLEPFGQLFEKDFKGDDKKFEDWLKKAGFESVPAGDLLGGVVLEEDGRIERICSLHLVGIRSLAGKDEEETKLLQTYILALGLVAMTAPQDYNLRQGCLLIRKEGKLEQVYRNGDRKLIELKHEEILEFAKQIAKEFMKKVGVPKEEIRKKLTYEKLREWKKKTEKEK